MMPLDHKEKPLGRTGFKMSLLLPREMGLYSDIATPFSSRAREPNEDQCKMSCVFVLFYVFVLLSQILFCLFVVGEDEML